MLYGIDTGVTPELLFCLAQMGHGDEIAVVDSNFPSVSTARTCTISGVIRYPDQDAPSVVDMITKLMPLDPFSAYAALRMQSDDTPDDLTDAHREVWDILTPCLPEGAALSAISRPDFYAQAARSFAIVQCGETRPFGCFILRKGVIF
ncbi:RbsD/FucU family protein [Rhodophyticola sp. CCM32]|uniref:RbsD/FucU family protein n=1 Tax=Rhodophyticola sp. CCM32 TaxID=2916397 RepID=UPI001EE631B3|nr:RbsD/FucU domain-containing protein [Rhodophyticola sp. CCM32]